MESLAVVAARELYWSQNAKMRNLNRNPDKSEKEPRSIRVENQKTQFDKAIDYHAKGDLVNAEKHYRSLIESGVISYAVLSNLGVICQHSARTQEAIELYKKAIIIDQNHPDAYTNIGALYKDLGRLDEALESTLKSLELEAKNAIALRNLGGIYKDKGHSRHLTIHLSH